jgi:exopolyphosphatase
MCESQQALLNCQQAGQLRLTITDHNLLGHDFKDLSPSVVGIVDHHVDQSDPLHANLSQEKEIVVVGSATTLVAERYLAVTPLPRLTPKHEFDPTTLIDASISNLLLGTILIDTVNMKPSMARGTPRDQAAIDAIVKSVLASGDQFGLASVDERTELFEYLQAVKFDLSRLTSAELLRKDYKSWFAYKKYGISSVTLSTAEWVSKDAEMATSFASYIKEQDIAFLIVLTSFTDPEFKREVMALAAPGSEALLDHVLSAVMETLTLSAVPTPSSLSSSGSHIKFFSQADIKLSRKQVQPAIHDTLLSYESRL